MLKKSYLIELEKREKIIRSFEFTVSVETESDGEFPLVGVAVKYRGNKFTATLSKESITDGYTSMTLITDIAKAAAAEIFSPHIANALRSKKLQQELLDLIVKNI